MSQLCKMLNLVGKENRKCKGYGVRKYLGNLRNRREGNEIDGGDFVEVGRSYVLQSFVGQFKKYGFIFKIVRSY